MSELRVLVVACATTSVAGAAALAARLGAPARHAPSPHEAARLIDRDSVEVCVVAQDALDAQKSAVRALKRLPAPLPVLAESAVTDPLVLVALLRAGVDGVVLPGASVPALRRCLHAALGGEVVLPRGAVRHLAAEVRLAALRDSRAEPVLSVLSDREREVAVPLYAGLSTSEVAARLYISQTTVRSHLHGMQRKLRVRSRDDVFRLLDGS